ncbi:hypothetical protein CP061683_0780A, partial [Chlamydia psittaci 06-1683]
MRNSFFT